MPSISRQLLISASLVLAVFVILTAASVQYAVHQRARTATYDRLQGLIYGILGATEVSDDGTLRVDAGALPDTRLSRPGIGLYAEVVGFDGAPVWRSSSMTLSVPDVSIQPIGQWVFDVIDTTDEGGKPLSLQRLQFSAAWAFSDGQELPFTVQVVLDSQDVKRELRSFDRNLWLALAGSAIALLLIQAIVLRRGLQPLTRVGAQIQQVERGEREQLDTAVPQELVPLADSINTLLASERSRHRQYRDLLEDLAHSLKTPLSVLKNLAGGQPTADPSSDTPTDRLLMRQQIERVQDTLDRYLERAAASTPQPLAAPVSPRPVLQRLVRSLEKLHAGRGVHIDLSDLDGLLVRAAEIDLMEMLGNILENACKYGAHHVRVASDQQARCITISDDGPGFDEAILPRLMLRGTRADRSVEGQGLGLAATAERLESYGGRLELGNSPEGGARVTLQFPG